MKDDSRQPDICDVRAFWDANPLWTGEAREQVGSRAFFDEHRKTVCQDCFAGRLDERIFPKIDRDARILDLGCGIGFWLVEFWERGFKVLHGADLSINSLAIARQRCSIYGVEAALSVHNAEAVGFQSESFDHVNCQGVIHHTPSPPYVLREIRTILKPGGSASISVYFKNVVLRNWTYLQPLSRLCASLGGGLRGRSREDIMAYHDVSDIVRRYDGDANPIGLAYSRSEFRNLIGPGFAIEDIYFHFFPARAMPIQLPQAMHATLDRAVPFMIYANLRKLML